MSDIWDRFREKTSKSGRGVIRLVAIASVTALLVLSLLNLRLNARASLTLLQTDESSYFLPSEDWLVPTSLGYREALAGLIWVRLLTYFGEQHEVRGQFDHMERYLFAVTELDPYFYRAYTWGSVAAMYNGMPITRDAIELSIEMLRRGLVYFPNDGDLHYFIGFQHYFELSAVVSGDERERVRQIGMDEICTGAILGGGPPYLPLLCSSLNERAGFDQIAQERLAQTLLDVRDERTRIRIEERMEGMMAADISHTIMRHASELREGWENNLPYAPLSLYLLTGPRPVVPREHDIELPTHLDDIIAAETEELMLRLEAEEENEPVPLFEELDEGEEQHSVGETP